MAFVGKTNDSRLCSMITALVSNSSLLDSILLWISCATQVAPMSFILKVAENYFIILFLPKDPRMLLRNRSSFKDRAAQTAIIDNL